MSTRIRIWAFHPDYGRFAGRDAVTQLCNIETVVERAGKMPRGPFKTKLHRLKAIGELMDWKVRLFRVPRKVDLSRTKWGAFLAAQGMFPRKLRGGKAPQQELAIQPPPQGAGIMAVGNPAQAVPPVWGNDLAVFLGERIAARQAQQQLNMQAAQQAQGPFLDVEGIRQFNEQLRNVQWVVRPPQIRQVNEENNGRELYMLDARGRIVRRHEL